MSFWRKQPMLKGYVSEIDQFLQAFDQKPESSSVSRRAEEVKYAMIHTLRDRSDASQASFEIWEEF